jgi:hypothetical protein
MSALQGFEPNTERKMHQLLKLAAAPATGLFALALAGIATPAAAGPYEYCRTDVSSAMRSCSFRTMEECQAMSAGRGGSCARDPFLPAVSTSSAGGAYGYQPKAGPRHAKKPVH